MISISAIQSVFAVQKESETMLKTKVMAVFQ